MLVEKLVVKLVSLVRMMAELSVDKMVYLLVEMMVVVMVD
jgi:hypothetical protein